MSEIKHTDKKLTKLTLGSSKLKLGGTKGVASVQNFVNKSKNVVVEVKKSRTRGVSAKKDSDNNPVAGGEDAGNSSGNQGGLTSRERNLRVKVLQQAAHDDRVEQEQQRVLEEEKRIREAEEAVAEQESRRKEEELSASEKKQEAEPAKEIAEGNVAPVAEAVEKKPDESYDFVNPIKSSERANVPAKEISKKSVRPDFEEQKRNAKSVKSDAKRRSNKLTVAQALSGREERVRSLASVRRAREKARRNSGNVEQVAKEKIIREVIIPETITVQELSNRMAERVYDLVKTLMKMGMMVTSHQTIDADTAELLVGEFGHTFRRVTEADVEQSVLHDVADDESDLTKRAPVVTFMGHVDHGKTSLLDTIRKTQVVTGEAGGITQHIGAYQVKVNDDEKITFLDTPGHEAFTAMRQRGANATDIVVLVVAADDGIMAQTREAISHAKAAEVPIIVAVNKIDKPGADSAAVKNALLEFELISEDLGGDTLVIEVSAKTAQNIEALLEAILLQAEMLDLKASTKRKADGVVVEAHVDKYKGSVATILVQRGMLRIGDIVVAGNSWGKVRAMTDSEGRNVHKAGPSFPVSILGLEGVPAAGSAAAVVETEKQARDVTEYRVKRERDLRSVSTLKEKKSIDDMFRIARDGGRKELNVIIKGDVQGSVEAINGSLEKLATDEVAVKILHSAVGGLTTSDITLASASNAIILGFNVRADAAAKELSVKEGSDIRYYSIIYDLIDDIKALMSGMLTPRRREKYLGNAEIRDVFNISKKGTKVAGCFVTDGVIKRGAGVRLLRDNIVIHEGSLKTLRRFKDDVKEVSNNFECGIAFENYDDIKIGDVIEAFEVFEEARSL